MVLVIAFALGVLFAAVVAGMVWINLEYGNDHPLSPEEIRQRVGETWG